MSIKTILEKAGLTPKQTSSGPSGPEEGASGPSGPEEGASGPSGPEEGASGPSGPEEGASGPIINEDNIEEELLLKAINKKRGTNFKTLDEINVPTPAPPTSEEIAAQTQEKLNNVRAYGLQNKKVTTTELDEYARESSSPVIDLARDIYKRERIEALRKANTPEADMPDDTTLENEFNELNFLYAKDDDPKKVKAVSRLKAEVDHYLDTKYEKILNLESEYDEHVNNSSARTNYNNTVDQIFNDVIVECAEMTFEVDGDKEGTKVPYKFKPTKEIFEKVKKSYTSDNSFNAFGKTSLNAAILKQAVKNSITQEAFGQIVSNVANAHASAKVEALGKKRRNIPDKETQSDTRQVVENATIKKILGKKENQTILNN